MPLDESLLGGHTIGAGLAFGEVVAVDKAKPYMVQVSIDGMEPYGEDTDQGYWCTVMTPMAGAARGLYVFPEVGDLVIVGFLHGVADYGVVLGFRWGKNASGVEQKPPFTNDGKNPVKGWVSKAGHKLELDDTQDAEQIRITDASAKNTIVIDSKAGSLTVTIEGDIKLAGKKTITLDVPDGDMAINCTNFTVKASGAVSIDGDSGAVATTQGLEIKGQSVKITGNPVDLNAGNLKVM